MVYIITLSASDNCGSLLQAYALQSFIEKKLKKEVKIIDFSSKESRKMYATFSMRCLKHPKSAVRRIKNLKFISQEKEYYQFFRDNFLNMTEQKYQDVSDLQKEDFSKDIFITGSDQVWNVKMYDFSPAFFCCWKAKRKIAYAASMGNTDIARYKNKNEMINWLNNFHRISVREDKARIDLKNYAGLSVPVLLDPTLLLDEETWRDVVDKPLIEEPYVFYYSWNYHNKEYSQAVKEFGRKTGLPVYVINLFRWGSDVPSDYGFNILNESGPQTYLNLIKNASYVFVESFHGVIFSYIFRRNFWLLDKKEFSEIDVRLKSILKLIHMEDRIVHSKNEIEFLDLKNISWDECKELKARKKDSISFLQEALL